MSSRAVWLEAQRRQQERIGQGDDEFVDLQEQRRVARATLEAEDSPVVQSVVTKLLPPDLPVQKPVKTSIAEKKIAIAIRLDADVIEHYKAMGRGWQTRINDDLARLIRK